jgi:predicted nucleotidyltransferase
MKQSAEDHREIVALYVFGSLATGRNQSRSDVDVAIMVNRRMGGMERVEWETSLANLLGRDVDLILFGEATPLLRHQVLKYGRLLFEKDSRERVEQEVAARREYLDGLSLHKMIEGRQSW